MNTRKRRSITGSARSGGDTTTKRQRNHAAGTWLHHTSSDHAGRENSNEERPLTQSDIPQIVQHVVAL